jgi:hypothetical protein
VGDREDAEPGRRQAEDHVCDPRRVTGETRDGRGATEASATAAPATFSTTTSQFVTVNPDAYSAYGPSANRSVSSYATLTAANARHDSAMSQAVTVTAGRGPGEVRSRGISGALVEVTPGR